MRNLQRSSVLLGWILSLVLAAHLAVAGMAVAVQQPAEEAQREVEETLAQARREIQQFGRDGGKAEDAAHPVAGWVEKLWAFRDRYPGTKAAATAASEAIHLLVHAHRYDRVEELADSLPLGDPAWDSLPRYLLEAANLAKDYRYFLRKSEALLAAATEPERRAELLTQRGRAFWQSGELEAAIAAFTAARDAAPESDFAKQAENALYDLTQLAPGQPAPAFSATARDGRAVTLAGYRGRAVVLIFWSTT